MSAAPTDSDLSGQGSAVCLLEAPWVSRVLTLKDKPSVEKLSFSMCGPQLAASPWATVSYKILRSQPTPTESAPLSGAQPPRGF